MPKEGIIMYDMEQIYEKLTALGVKSKSDINRVIKELNALDIEGKLAGTLDAVKKAGYKKGIKVGKDKGILIGIGATVLTVGVIATTFYLIKKNQEDDMVVVDVEIKEPKKSKKAKAAAEKETVEDTTDEATVEEDVEETTAE